MYASDYNSFSTSITGATRDANLSIITPKTAFLSSKTHIIFEKCFVTAPNGDKFEMAEAIIHLCNHSKFDKRT